MTSRYPDWAVEGQGWPHRDSSSFVAAGGYRWHVQRMGAGPVCLLLHGTGAATHSWRDLLPLLAERFDVIAIDLPGHGFTRPDFGQKPTLPAMAAGVTALLAALEAQPALVVGHSAGVAVAAQWVLDRGQAVPLVGFAPALMPFPGLAARMFPSLAKILFTNPFVSIIVSRLMAGHGEVERFLQRATGSRLDSRGYDLYRRLFRKSGHCDGAIRMMANWQLEPLRDRLPSLAAPVLLVQAGRDSAIPASAVAAAAALIPGCGVRSIDALGHLAHEEDPAAAAALITEFYTANTDQS
jgi:magnesium chelatase accessory protein